jgi:hypothetical protein
MRSVKSVLLLALVLGGCSDSFAPAFVAGKWDEDFTVPGSSLEMDLTLSGSNVSGSGNWCAEAGPCGILIITGTVTGDSVQLDLIYIAQLPTPLPPSARYFTGRLTSLNSLQGSVSLGTPGTDQHMGFHRA